MSYTIYYIYYTVYIKYHILDILYQILYIHILYTYYICTRCLDVTPSAGPRSSGPPSPPSSERNRPAAPSSSPLWKPPCLRASRGLVKNDGNPMGIFWKNAERWNILKKTWENHKKKIEGWNFAVGENKAVCRGMVRVTFQINIGITWEYTSFKDKAIWDITTTAYGLTNVWIGIDGLSQAVNAIDANCPVDVDNYTWVYSIQLQLLSCPSTPEEV